MSEYIVMNKNENCVSEIVKEILIQNKEVDSCTLSSACMSVLSHLMTKCPGNMADQFYTFISSIEPIYVEAKIALNRNAQEWNVK